MKKLEGKVAVVTGASKGIGAAIARRFAAEGAAVVVNYASSRTDAERVVAEIAATGGRAIAIHADVGHPADVVRLFAESAQAFGPAHVLVNNAGVYQFGPLDEITAAEFHREFDINVLGTLLASQEAARQFGATGGSIVNVGSVVSTNPLANSAIYAATKGAVDTLTRALATELGPRGIRVNVLAPGVVETEGAHSAGVIGSDFEKMLVAATPLGRTGQPDDIARVAVFLASDDAAWVTGERFVAAGGWR